MMLTVSIVRAPPRSAPLDGAEIRLRVIAPVPEPEVAPINELNSAVSGRKPSRLTTRRIEFRRGILLTKSEYELIPPTVSPQKPDQEVAMCLYLYLAPCLGRYYSFLPL